MLMILVPLSSVLYWNDYLLLVISRNKIIQCAMRFYKIPVLIPRKTRKKDAYTLKAVKTALRLLSLDRIEQVWLTCCVLHTTGYSRLTSTMLNMTGSIKAPILVSMN